MSTKIEKPNAPAILAGLSIVLCVAAAIIAGMNGQYGLAAMMLSMMSLCTLMVGVYMKRSAPSCSEEQAEATLE